MTEPLVIEPLKMRNVGDCVICCLAMLLGKSYLEVCMACPRRGRPSENGLSTTQAVRIAHKLGHRLSLTKTIEEDEIGIIDLERHEDYGEDGHFAMYLKGVVYDPARGELWTDVDAFLTHGHWVVSGFLWRKE